MYVFKLMGGSYAKNRLKIKCRYLAKAYQFFPLIFTLLIALFVTIGVYGDNVLLTFRNLASHI